MPLLVFVDDRTAENQSRCLDLVLNLVWTDKHKSASSLAVDVRDAATYLWFCLDV